jgi:hypothetical protein
MIILITSAYCLILLSPFNGFILKPVPVTTTPVMAYVLALPILEICSGVDSRQNL